MKIALYFPQAQTQQTMRCLQKEFERLHQFLRDEEMIRISALIEEENQKSQMMKEKIEQIDREIESLSNNIGTIKNDLDAGVMPFLQVRNVLLYLSFFIIVFLYCFIAFVYKNQDTEVTLIRFEVVVKRYISHQPPCSLRYQHQLSKNQYRLTTS